MTRPQVNDQFGTQRLQTQARTVAPTVVAPGAAVDRRWETLGNVLAQAEVLADKAIERDNLEQRENAARYANSMTVEKLGKQIKEGTLNTASPRSLVRSAMFMRVLS
jgi:hypothetical protein